MGLVNMTIWLVAVPIGLLLLYIGVVSVLVMAVGIFEGSGELAGGGFAGLICTVVLIVAPVAWCMSRLKRSRVIDDESKRF